MVNNNQLPPRSEDGDVNFVDKFCYINIIAITILTKIPAKNTARTHVTNIGSNYSESLAPSNHPCLV